MSVSRNEEPPQLPMSFNHSSAIPIKKRRFPLIQSEEKPPCSADNRKDSEIPGHGLSLVAASGDVDNSSQSGLTKNPPPSTVTDSKIESKEGAFASKIQDLKPNISFGNKDGLASKVDEVSTKESAKMVEVPRTGAGVVANLTMVKKEVVSEQAEDRCRLELSSSLKNNELLLNPKGPLVDAFQPQNSESLSHESHKLDPSLSLASREEKTLVFSKDSTINNRSSWDLNTTMDEWEGSTCNDSIINKSGDVGSSGKSDSIQDLKSSLGVAGVMCLSLNKVRGMNEGSSYSCDSALYSSLKNKPDDSLGLSLAMPGREFVSKSCLSQKSESSSAGPKLKLQQVSLRTKVMNFTSPKAVKSEPVDENSRHGLGIGSSCCGMSLLKLSSVKKEIADKQTSEAVLPSATKLADLRLVKSELVKTNKDACKSNDSMLPRSDGRIMQHQESCASSSPLPMVLTPPPSSGPSRWLNSSELTISEELSNQSQHSIRSEDVSDRKNIPAANVASEVYTDVKASNPHEADNSNVEHSGNSKLTGSDENPPELRQNSVDMDISEDVHGEDSTKSDCESIHNRVAVGQKLCKREDGEYEEGELPESVRRAAEEAAIVGGRIGNAKMVGCETRNLPPLVSSGNVNLAGSDIDRKATRTDNLDENHKEHIKECVAVGFEHCPEGSSLQKSSEAETDINHKRPVGASTEKRLEVPERNDIVEGTRKEGSTDGNHGAGTRLSECATDEVVAKEICSSKQNSPSSRAEACTNDNGAAKDSSSSGNKSRIINLPRASPITTPPGKTRFPNRLTSRSGKERYPDFDGETRPRWKRDEMYNDGLNKFGKDKVVHDPSFRNSRPNFMLGKGRMSGRFGPVRNEWDSNHEFVSENYNGPSDYRIPRHKHPSSVSSAELEYNNGYGISSDVIASSSGRRKLMNDDHRFMRQQMPEEAIDPVFTRPQNMYEGLDGQHVRGNRNFTTMHRKVYSQIRSKSPVRSRTRSPSPWSSRRRRSPDELQELNQQRRSPGLYRMRRTRSPDRSCFRDDAIVRRRGSPPFVPRHHNNEFRDMEPGREQVYPRPINSMRRSPPSRGFPRNGRRSDGLDSRERDDGGIDERRKFIEGRGPFRPFHRQGYNGENENMRFYVNDGPPPRPFRYCPDSNVEFFEKNNMREREFERERDFEGRMNHQSMGVVPKRIRNLEEQQDGNYGSGSRVWHNDGFGDMSGGKRRRF